MTKIGYAAIWSNSTRTTSSSGVPRPRKRASRRGSWSRSISIPGPPSRVRGSAWRSWAPDSARRCASGPPSRAPGFRYHPAVIAHAAATLGATVSRRFYLGLGAGEALNEHVIAPVWPEVPIRSAMMFEAIEVISKLFTGQAVRHDGKYFTLERPSHTRPPDDQRVPIYIATAGPVNAKEDRQARGRPDHGRRCRREDDDLGQVRGGPCRGRQGPQGRAEDAADPHLMGAHRG